MSAKAFKQFVKNLPYLDALFDERDRLRGELAAVAADRDALAAARASLEQERGELLREAAARESALRILEQSIQALQSANETLKTELQHVRAEAEAARSLNNSLTEQSATLSAEVVSLQAEKQAAEREAARWRTWVAPGHFYSPFPDTEEILRHEHEIWRKPLPGREIPGVELREEAQLELLREFLTYYREQPFTAERQAHLRYYFDNENYSYSDAIFLYSMLRHLRPRRFIEVGSGFSSCVTLDTDEHFLEHSLSCTFIDPHPELLLSMIKEEDKARIEILGRPIQQVSLDLFSELSAGDVLFVDSTHVAKTLSDVNHIFFEILPRLKPGVLIHLHDIFYPFVYPKDWELEQRAWNEAYLLRAFLQYNDSFQIYFCNTFLEYFHDAKFKAEMPLCMKNTGGSIWLRKIR